jgi:hypothetical protein
MQQKEGAVPEGGCVAGQVEVREVVRLSNSWLNVAVDGL